MRASPAKIILVIINFSAWIYIIVSVSHCKPRCGYCLCFYNKIYYVIRSSVIYDAIFHFSNSISAAQGCSSGPGSRPRLPEPPRRGRAKRRFSRPGKKGHERASEGHLKCVATPRRRWEMCSFGERSEMRRYFPPMAVSSVLMGPFGTIGHYSWPPSLVHSAAITYRWTLCVIDWHTGLSDPRRQLQISLLCWRHIEKKLAQRDTSGNTRDETNGHDIS